MLEVLMWIVGVLFAVWLALFLFLKWKFRHLKHD